MPCCANLVCTRPGGATSPAAIPALQSLFASDSEALEFAIHTGKLGREDDYFALPRSSESEDQTNELDPLTNNYSNIHSFNLKSSIKQRVVGYKLFLDNEQTRNSSYNIKSIGSTLSNYNDKPIESIFFHTQIMPST